MNESEVSREIVDAALKIHQKLGPGLKLGLLINFGAATLKEGVVRVVNGLPD